jgi:hypothetical protein
VNHLTKDWKNWLIKVILKCLLNAQKTKLIFIKKMIGGVNLGLTVAQQAGR